MRKAALIILAAILCPVSLLAQQNTPVNSFVPTVRRYHGAPPLSIPCLQYEIAYDDVGGALYPCSQTGVFQLSDAPVVFADQKCNTPGVYDQSCFTNAITALGGNSGLILAANHAYSSNAAITCAGTAFTINQRIIGYSNGTTGGTVVTFTGATNGFNNCELVDIAVSTSNAGALIGVFMSGLHQELRNVLITQSGSGLWAKGIQQFGSVTNTLAYPECQNGAATICLDVVPNGVNQVGALTILGGEYRSASGGTGIHLNNLLSGSMIGGSIEGTGIGLLADTNPSDFSQYGTHFESNTVGDVQWVTGGQYTQTDVQFPGGSPFNFNCPNATCTALLKVTGAHGTLNSTWTFGNSIAAGSYFGQSIISGTGKLTNNAAGALTVMQVSTRDATVVNNVIGYNNGNSIARLDLTPNSGGSTFTIQSDNSGNASLTSNGSTFLKSTGNGSAQLTTPVAFASLGAVPAAGTMRYCTDCTTAATCAGAGSGHLAVSNGTNWTCQ